MFTGCGTAMVTPFQADGSLDEATLRRLVRRQIEEGIDFLWLNNPVEILGDSSGWVTGMRVQKIVLSAGLMGVLAIPTLYVTSPSARFARGEPKVLTRHRGRFFSLEANSGWNWGSVFTGNDAVESIRRAMSRNRRLKILATAGYFDLDIPYFATTYIMNHLGIDPEIAGNIKVRFFPGGHMFYTNSETLEEFTGDAAQFFTDITGGPVRPPDQVRGKP